MIDGYNNRLKGEMERMRILAYTVARFGNSDRRKFPKSPKEFMPFAWEGGKVKQKLTPSEILERHRQMKEKRKELGSAI